ncbi:aminotransferase class I/II-fold pyridoxal phosphate-dependent enzyme [Pseudomonas monteilii]|uniref:aminotransferase class I/II-fold pyridoxal phosphate-dependent enzyme n=1 Tax=Pseudomonas monteilii TaxID=76759 RepID=UPI00086375C7|nr:aminotransferase class I/II-fold pyridoxal phosphate-dependent enzyme [Pseudomonas monteilii]
MGRSARGEFAYQGVYRYLDALIAQADYAEQGRLPSLRDLARRLRVSLATVQCAYSLLERQGRVRSVPKSGYFVNFAEREVDSPGADAALVLPAFPLPMPSPRTLERTLLAHERRLSRQGGEATWRLGNGALLRSALATRYTRASGHCWNARHVHLATDVQALLETLLLALHLQGATAVVATPCCWLLLNGLQQAGMRVLEAPMAAHGGLDIRAFARLLEREPVQLVVMPSCLSVPLGRLMPAQDQQQLARLLAEHSALLLENDLDSDHCFAGPPASRLRDGIDASRLLILGSLEATIGAEAPYAYLLCRQPGVDEAIVRRGFLLPPLRQHAVANTFAKGEVDESLAALRFDLQARMEHLCSRIELRLGTHLAFARPDGGRGIWARLNQPIDTKVLLAAVAGTPLSVIPGELFGLKGSFPQHVLLVWCAESWDGLEQALRRLGRGLVGR